MADSIVGRNSERQRLTDWLAAAAAGQPVTVLIDGDAGVGKTKLIGWLAEEATRRRALVLSGSCIELNGGTSIPYGALIEAMRLFVRREGLERARRLMGGSWAVLAGLASDFAAVAPVSSAPDTQPRIFGAVLRLADYIGRRAPLLLILEDVHSADASTLDLIRYLTKAKTDQQLLLACSFRPVTTAARHPLQALLGDPDFTRRIQRLHLAPFKRPELDAFVTALAGRAIPEDRLQRYFALSEGNAYYAEQLVTAEATPGSDVEVPQSLRALMLARINQLSDRAADVVRVAAVAGGTVDDDLLVAVSDLDETALDRALRECLSQRILTHDGTDDAYTFEHALLRDTAYQQILPRSRKRMHARIAEVLARTASRHTSATTRLMAEVADHWFAAGRLPEAFAAALRAAGSAVRVHAFAEAEALYARALRLWPDIEDAPALAGGSKERTLGQAADAARWAGHMAQALDWVREAIAEVATGADPGRRGELFERLGSYLWEAGEYGDSAAAYAEAERLLDGLPPSAVASRVQAALATAALRGGAYRTGLERARRAVELARTVGARAEEGRALNSVGLALTFQGQIEAGEGSLRTALAIAAEVDHLEDLFRAYGNLGVCLEHAGRLRDVVAVMTEGLARAKEHGLLGTRQSGVLANNAAAALLSLGRYAEAADLLDSNLLDRPVEQSLYARLTRAEISVAQGDLAGAERLLAQIRTRPNTDPRFIGPLYTCMAELALWRGQLDEARAIVVRGMEALQAARDTWIIAQLCVVGLRVAADLRCGLGAADPAGRELTTWTDELAAAVAAAPVVTDGYGDEAALLVQQCHAECARATGSDSAQLWAKLAEGWAGCERPLRRAYALGWQAVAHARTGARDEARAVARQAYAIADEIGARPMRDHLVGLATAARLRLGRPRPYGLTRRELEVLRELTIGRPDREIGEILYISPKTVSVHVSAILSKLGVSNRTAAADLARREGLTIVDGSGEPSARSQ